MKYVNYEEATRNIIGYYDDEIHEVIPEPNLKITDSQWETALENNSNYVNIDGELITVDLRTNEDKIKDYIKLGESIVNRYIQSIVDVYNKEHGLSFKDVHSCANYKDMENYTHRQFCIDIWNFNVQVWEEVRNVILPSIDFNNPPSEEQFLAMLPIYNGLS